MRSSLHKNLSYDGNNICTSSSFATATHYILRNVKWGEKFRNHFDKLWLLDVVVYYLFRGATFLWLRPYCVQTQWLPYIHKK